MLHQSKYPSESKEIILIDGEPYVKYGNKIGRKPLREYMIDNPHYGSWPIAIDEVMTGGRRIYGNALRWALESNDADLIDEILKPMTDKERHDYFHSKGFMRFEAYSMYGTCGAEMRKSFIEYLASFNNRDFLSWDFENEATRRAVDYFRTTEKKLAESASGAEIGR